MTTKEYLNARADRQIWIMIAWLLLGCFTIKFTRFFWLAFVFLTLALGWIVVTFQVMKRCRCLKCHTRLGSAAFGVMSAGLVIMGVGVVELARTDRFSGWQLVLIALGTIVLTLMLRGLLFGAMWRFHPGH